MQISINRLCSFAFALMFVMALASCKKEQKNNDIIVKKHVAKVDKGVQNMADNTVKRDVEWLGATYKICIERKTDSSLPLTTDESGNKYYDNKVRLVITRPDGSEFFSRSFSKADFAQYVDDSNKGGALLGIVFDSVDGDALKFAASVGSPDRMSDEYVPLVMEISRVGGVKISKDTQLDTTNADANVAGSANSKFDADDDGV